MNEHEFPIIEHDPCTDAIINPPPGKDGFRLPERAVLCFPQKTIDVVVADGVREPIHHLESSMGKHPIYAVEAFGTTIGICQPGLGAPFYAALGYEESAVFFRRLL